jgi:hypothetical protein
VVLKVLSPEGKPWASYGVKNGKEINVEVTLGERSD